MNSAVLNKIEEERRNLLRYYWWQVGWGVLFLVLVFVSSFVLGARSDKFWIYVIIPLIVAGSFWIYVQSTRKSVNLKYNQRALKLLLPEYFPEWQFYPIFRIDRQMFEAAGFVADFDGLETRNGLVGKIDGRNVIFTYVLAQAPRYDDTREVYVFGGVFVTVEQKFGLPVFGVYPKHKDTSRIKEKFGLFEVPVKLSSDFTVLVQSESNADKIDDWGPVILKYSHLCGEPENFYFTTLGGRMNIGIGDMKDLIDLDIKLPVSEELISGQMKRLRSCLDFIADMCERIKMTYG